MSQYDDILAERSALRSLLASMDSELQSQVEEINDAIFRSGDPPTQATKDKRSKLRASQAELGRLFKMLAFVTATRLDSSDKVSRLLADLGEINQEIQDEIEWLGELQETAEAAAQLTAGLNALATKIEKIADTA